MQFSNNFIKITRNHQSYRDADLSDPGRLDPGLLETDRPDTGLWVELTEDDCDDDRDRSEL